MVAKVRSIKVEDEDWKRWQEEARGADVSLTGLITAMMNRQALDGDAVPKPVGTPIDLGALEATWLAKYQASVEADDTELVRLRGEVATLEKRNKGLEAGIIAIRDELTETKKALAVARTPRMEPVRVVDLKASHPSGPKLADPVPRGLVGEATLIPKTSWKGPKE